jgi:hypothetical protein
LLAWRFAAFQVFPAVAASFFPASVEFAAEDFAAEGLFQRAALPVLLWGSLPRLAQAAV